VINFLKNHTLEYRQEFGFFNLNKKVELNITTQTKTRRDTVQKKADKLSLVDKIGKFIEQMSNSSPIFTGALLILDFPEKWTLLS
jgi:hypothetical protein